MSDSDRQLYFADYVIELQTAEDEKRRRIRDARRRAEKAQRDAYRATLRGMAEAGTILPSSRWRSVEDKIASDPSFEPVHAQGREVPRELFEDFVEEWNEVYRRDRSILTSVLASAQKEFKVEENTTLDEFNNTLLDSSSHSPNLYGEIRRMLNRENQNPLSSTELFFNELKAENAADVKIGLGNFARQNILNGGESSEDEGEIIEDGEVKEEGAKVSSGKEFQIENCA